MTETLRITSAGATDVGCGREHNEDGFGIFPGLGLYVIVDGMGGVAAGEVATKITLATMQAFFDQTRKSPEAPWPFKGERRRSYEENRLAVAVQLAGLRVFESSEANLVHRGMGAAVAAIAAQGGVVHVAHVGDARVYRLRRHELKQLTRDHSLINEYITLMPEITEEQLNELPRNVITRALGMKREPVQVDVTSETPEDGDLYLLCTDGLWGVLAEDAIAGHLAWADDLDAAVARLIRAARAQHVQDNVGCVLLRFGDRPSIEPGPPSW